MQRSILFFILIVFFLLEFMSLPVFAETHALPSKTGGSPGVDDTFKGSGGTQDGQGTSYGASSTNDDESSLPHDNKINEPGNIVNPCYGTPKPSWCKEAGAYE